MTLNTEAITSQKIAVGLVENPCCWALRDLAILVPAGERIVELGAFKGRTTGWLALGAHLGGKGVRVTSVDPWEAAGPVPHWYLTSTTTVPLYREVETRLAYEHHLDETGIRPLVDVVQATATAAAAHYVGPPVGLLWHDALHRREDVRDDLRAWLPHLSPTAVIVLHDVGDPRYQVEAGARDALARRKAWDWENREIHIWPRQPERRGFMVVRRRA